MKFKPLIIRPIKEDLFYIAIEDIIDIKIDIDKEILIDVIDMIPDDNDLCGFNSEQIVLKRDEFYYPRWMNLIDTLNKIFEIK